ncbi:hypothetical protein PIB30_020102 [Stylosanthes scabra]|uniref:Uncharacterized protein n=1 Tax=Stylosanthes scabra TaxID=79078 RepID=A0ABU6W715_9FABA|nr:hypothetical protein [Stylosanthes scabra]
MSNVIKMMYDIPWTSYKKVPIEVKERWFAKWKGSFIMDHEDQSLVRKTFDYRMDRCLQHILEHGPPVLQYEEGWILVRFGVTWLESRARIVFTKWDPTLSTPSALIPKWDPQQGRVRLSPLSRPWMSYVHRSTSSVRALISKADEMKRLGSKSRKCSHRLSPG